ncbi:C40 family peptidase [Paenisporosarcina cavernae]|uniref:NlpC/P60 family protein n=1 Tax=Paenisporosarcina cavernae TaxID=2320858 RepID=A0A385YR00_9BACL|nr:C40 family peptidase [Paenisporosarcina cavernae]AYC28924.1 NlpC/P60 family protein [Paenisporosarcina cavernae]
MLVKSQMLKLISVIAIIAVLMLSAFSQEAQAASSLNSKQIVTTSSSVLGVKYKRGGTTTAGFDCSGFIGYVYKSSGVNLPRTSAGMYATGKSVAKKSLQVGDLVFFNTSGKGVSHVGIYIGNGKFVHSSSSKGVSIAKLNDPYYWGDKYIGAKRVANVATVASK